MTEQEQDDPHWLTPELREVAIGVANAISVMLSLRHTIPLQYVMTFLQIAQEEARLDSSFVAPSWQCVCSICYGFVSMSDDELRRILAARGLRPTRQRVILISFLLQDGGRPATVRAVITRAQDNGRRISRATVHNGLRDFE
ncbi:hypothetical protein [Bradyrhizobium sp. LMG 9283]|uniref:hypothetical protein n=1 Tax=Bradyrhizobium sp. LMG 9283 TaxID=592064 RepID=UPI00388DFDE8